MIRLKSDGEQWLLEAGCSRSSEACQPAVLDPLPALMADS